MSETFNAVAEIIAASSDVPRDEITPQSHVINDLGIDSLEFLDIAFEIDKKFAIKVPIESWTEDINEGKATDDQYFVMQSLCDEIDKLVGANA
jgi:acyl carrier protein